MTARNTWNCGEELSKKARLKLVSSRKSSELRVLVERSPGAWPPASLSIELAGLSKHLGNINQTSPHFVVYFYLYLIQK